jgi:hypothetical protein
MSDYRRYRRSNHNSSAGPTDAPAGPDEVPPSGPAERLLASLQVAGFHLRAADGKILVAPAGRLTQEQRDAIGKHRPELLALLVARDPAARHLEAEAERFGMAASSLRAAAASRCKRACRRTRHGSRRPRARVGEPGRSHRRDGAAAGKDGGRRSATMHGLLRARGHHSPCKRTSRCRLFLAHPGVPGS